jgi:hypothetical protein
LQAQLKEAGRQEHIDNILVRTCGKLAFSYQISTLRSLAPTKDSIGPRLQPLRAHTRRN